MANFFENESVLRTSRLQRWRRVLPYALIDVATGQAGDPQSTTASEFAQLIRTDQRFYQGNSTPGKQTYITYQYDALGNITQVFDAGDAGAQDDPQTDITYAACPASYVMDAQTRVVSSSSATAKARPTAQPATSRRPARCWPTATRR